MSIQAVSWAIEQDLPARPALVLISIANHANHVDGYCWLEAETIAKEAKCTPRSVFRYVAALIRNGYIRKAPRKGEDGKQRANDYWILFGREESSWQWGGRDERDDEIEEYSPGDEPPAESEKPPESEPPYDRLSYGGDAQESHGEAEKSTPCHTDRMTVESSGRESLKPTKTNTKRDAGASERASAPPRAYQPPPPAPPEPKGAIVADRQARKIFVFVDDRPGSAWQHWLDEKLRTTGTRSLPITTAVVDGRSRRGWYLPSLYPPKPQATASPTPLMTEADQAEAAKLMG